MEIMVVIAIIGLITAVVMVNFSDNRRDTQLDQQAEQLNALFDYVREQAELQTRDYGFRVNNRTYSFVVFDIMGNQWRPVDEDEALREREFPEGIEPKVVVEGRSIVLDVKKKKIEDYSPQIMVFANGDLSSFEVILQREGSALAARLFSDEESHIQLVMPGETEPRVPAVRTAASK
jgi:type II secretion system protein H